MRLQRMHNPPQSPSKRCTQAQLHPAAGTAFTALVSPPRGPLEMPSTSPAGRPRAHLALQSHQNVPAGLNLTDLPGHQSSVTPGQPEQPHHHP